MIKTTINCYYWRIHWSKSFVIIYVHLVIFVSLSIIYFWYKAVWKTSRNPFDQAWIHTIIWINAIYFFQSFFSCLHLLLRHILCCGCVFFPILWEFLFKSSTTSPPQSYINNIGTSLMSELLGTFPFKDNIWSERWFWIGFFLLLKMTYPIKL